MDEKEFRKWYSKWSKKTGIGKNPDDHLHYYDYRAAYKAGVKPELADDGYYHWPSKYKHDLHPNRFIVGKDLEIYDSKYGKKAKLEDMIMQAFQRKEHEEDLWQ